MTASYAGRRSWSPGTGVAGAACAEVLLGLGAQVTVLDRDVKRGRSTAAGGRRRPSSSATSHRPG